VRATVPCGRVPAMTSYQVACRPQYDADYRPNILSDRPNSQVKAANMETTKHGDYCIARWRCPHRVTRLRYPALFGAGQEWENKPCAPCSPLPTPRLNTAWLLLSGFVRTFRLSCCHGRATKHWSVGGAPVKVSPHFKYLGIHFHFSTGATYVTPWNTLGQTSSDTGDARRFRRLRVG
jgi:hypothetical protein